MSERVKYGDNVRLQDILEVHWESDYARQTMRFVVHDFTYHGVEIRYFALSKTKPSKALALLTCVGGHFKIGSYSAEVYRLGTTLVTQPALEGMENV